MEKGAATIYTRLFNEVSCDYRVLIVRSNSIAKKAEIIIYTGEMAVDFNEWPDVYRELDRWRLGNISFEFLSSIEATSYNI